MSKSNSSTRGLWATRKIHKGRVKFHGHWYYPDETYDGLLDGMWMVFHSYDIYDDNDCHYFYPFIVAWGTLEYQNEKDENRSTQLFHDSPLWHPKTRQERWTYWYPKRHDALELVNASDDVEMRQFLAMRCKEALAPGLSSDEWLDAIAWHFRSIYPDYQPVHTNPERYANVHKIEGLRNGNG